ncbi:sulfatase [Halomarina rubra]|uniref:Sulfatase n=1 Tax=Halomarina rubra TaxID=2071873 RepID=A0ABD6AQK6_9EURY
MSTVTDRPNILWVCTDQQRWDTLGCYGNEFVETPTLDSLAESGMQFTRAFAQSPVCSPSRASFLTGRYPRTTGVRGNGHPIPDRETPVTRSFADAGYTCGLAGKLHLSPCSPTRPEGSMPERRIDDGYAEFNWAHGSRYVHLTNEYRRWLRAEGVEYDPTPVDSSAYVTTSVAPEHSQTMWCADQAVDFIEATAEGDDPWLFSLNPYDPHHPFDPPAAYLDRYLDRLDDIPLPNYEPGELTEKPAIQAVCHEGAYANEEMWPASEMDDDDHRLLRAAYWAMCDLLDDAVERVLSALERTGQREDTIVVFTSDHGEQLGDHGIYLKGPFFYEEALRVPLVISWPDTYVSAETDTLVELVDLAPTLCEAAGIDPPNRMQGRSLHGALVGEESFEDHRESVYAEAYDLTHWASDVRATMVRTDQYKLVRHHGPNRAGELYDLSSDIDETVNHWNDPAYNDVQTDLLTTLSDRMAETVDPHPERVAPW